MKLTAGIGYILQYPQTAVPILWRSGTQHIGEQLQEFIGILGWLDTLLPGWIYLLYFALLLFFTVSCWWLPSEFFSGDIMLYKRR